MPLVESVGKLLNKNLNIPDNIYYKVKRRVYTDFGRQNLAFQNPELAKEYSQNNELPPNMIFLSDIDNVEWICSTCNNKFYTSVNHRVYANTGCPYCAGNLAIPGKTDILTVLPGYAQEITNMSTDELMHTLPYSTKEADWKCKICGHKWTSAIQQRTASKTGCPKCGSIPIIYTNEWKSIAEIKDNAKTLKKAVVFGETIDKISYAKLFEIVAIKVLSNNFNSINRIVDNNNYITSKDKKFILSYDSSIFRVPKYIEVNNTKIYYESHCGVTQTIGTMIKIPDEFNLEHNSIKVMLDADKINTKNVKYVTLAKNKTDWNVMYRLKLNESDTKTVIVFIGSRHSFKEAVILKLSSEIYYFGEIRDKSDLKQYNGTIPKFEDTEEFKKLKMAGKIRKQY